MTPATRSADPPRLATWLAGLRLPGEEREYALGDLVEEFHVVVVPAVGEAAARRWYWRQALRCVLRGRPRIRPSVAVRAPGPRGARMSSLARDVAFAVRVIHRAPVVSVAVVLTLALGIAANVAVFSVAWPVLGERLPFPNEDRLAYVLLSIDRNGRPASNPISPGDYFDLLNARSFERLAGFNLFAAERNLTGGSEPQRVRVGSITEDFFEVLALPPLLGRGMDARDFAPGIRSLVLSEPAWRRYFGANPEIVGTSVRMDGASWTVVGVMPAAAGVGTIDVDAWTAQPLDRASARATRSYFLAMIGRLRPGVTLAQANDELARLMRDVAERHPASNRMPSGAPLLARAESFRERLTGPGRPVFILLIGGAALVLVLAAINLAGLQVARNLARRRELAVRCALGATRMQLIRQMTIEALVLSALGGAVGLGAAALTLAGLAQVAPAAAWYEVSFRPTPAVVFFTLALTAVAGLAIGVAPALVASARRHVGSLQLRGESDNRVTTGLRAILIGAQVAMTVVLLIAAALTGFSLARVLRVDPGFELDQAIIADVRPPGSASQQIRFFDQLVERAEALPGVDRACAINNVPLDNDGGWMTFVAEGQSDAQRRGALPMGITPGCLDALRIQVLSGRRFERMETESVAIVSESMAKALWPDGAYAVGKRIHMGLVSGPLLTVIGVVEDIRAASLESAETRQVWMSASRGWPMPQRVIVSTRTTPELLARPLRSLLHDMDPDLALANVRTMHDIVGEATASRRFVLVLLAAFAAIAVALCAVGIYGVITYQIGQRTREIGIRVALGARRRHVVQAIAGHALVGVTAGLVVGAAGAAALSSLIASQLYEVSATEPGIFLAVALFVGVLTVIACWQPMRRMLGLNPVAALRAE